MKIDVNFDFTLDSPNYWTDFWERKDGRGGGGSDPDASSPMLQKYHQMLWSRPLPCGEVMSLEVDVKLYQDGGKQNRLKWKEFVFTSDSIVSSHRYIRLADVLDQFKKTVSDYRAYMEGWLHKADTIGGFIIWPCHWNSINQEKGCNPKICDRMDRTLECIRRFYKGEESPMTKCFDRDKKFFDLFVDFKGFVDFFFLQDLVNEEYSSVTMLLGDDKFTTPALAQTAEEYRQWLEAQLDFVTKRNERISRIS